jgi:hypothetical protein
LTSLFLFFLLRYLQLYLSMRIKHCSPNPAQLKEEPLRLGREPEPESSDSEPPKPESSDSESETPDDTNSEMNRNRSEISTTFLNEICLMFWL